MLAIAGEDIEFGNHLIIPRSAKGANDRSTLLPERLIEPLQFQLKTAQLIHQKDLKEGFSETLLPFALSKKYIPMRARNGFGSMSFLLLNGPPIRYLVW